MTRYRDRTVLNEFGVWLDEMKIKRDAAHIIAGNWPALMAACSPADLRPIRVRREAKERRRAG